MSVTFPRKEADDGSYLTMVLETPERRHAEVTLTYVTEAPAWKPSYRVVIGDAGEVMLEGWAIVDNTSGEDWKGVLVGVGASSALAFRYDLWSVRQVDRDLLASEEKFAIAPPTGVSPYGEASQAEELASLDSNEVRPGATSTTTGITLDKSYVKNLPQSRTFEAALGAAAGAQGSPYGVSFSGSTSAENRVDAPKPPPPVAQGDAKLAAIVAKLKAEKKDAVIEVHGPTGTEAAAAARGAAVRNKLVDDGVAASHIRVVSKLSPGAAEGVKVLAVAPGARATTAAPPQVRDRGPDLPVGASHFMAERPMTVRAGTSAMVAVVHDKTTGGIVYLYDPISERGDQRFAFRSVRLDNPTADTLEPGPVTVYGKGKFIGEGITEPVPPHASVVVPFALDKQIVVSSNADESDRIARLVTVQRGIATAEVQHRRETLLAAPSKFTKVGDSQLFEIELAPGETKIVEIAEATPVEKTLDLGSEEALGMMKFFIADPDASPELQAQIKALLATHRDAVDLVDKIATLRDQLAEYRVRSGELHAQLVSLKLVKTGGDLMAALRQRLVEVSDREQKATIDLVDAQEKLMLDRVKFQNQLADLKLTDATKRTVPER